jgi:hypothetical protein
MAIFKREHKDPAQEAYRQLAREKAIKRKFDFIGQTGKMDLDVDETDKYKRAEQRFRDEIAKPLEEGFGGGDFWPSADATTLTIMNGTKDDDIAEKTGFVRKSIMNNRAYKQKGSGRYLDEMYLPYHEKHKLARELFHHDDEKKPEDADWHDSKTSVDKVLEEMTRYRPNAENRERIRNAIDTFKQSDPKLHTYLKDKYKFATEEEEVGPFKAYDGHENVLSHEEVEKYKDTHVFTHGRTISEPWGDSLSAFDTKKWQIHPDGTKTRVSSLLPHTTGKSTSESHNHPFEDDDERKKMEYHHANLRDLHGESIENSGYYHGHIQAYTNDSKGLNHYIAKGKLMNYEPHSREFHYDDQSEAISSAIADAPPYANKIQVWTGLSKSNDVGSYAAKKKDEKEKLVGHFPAFTSTSLDPRSAAAFAKPKKADGFPHQNVHDMMRVDLPKAYHKGIYVDRVSENSGEYEYILDKGHNIEVHPKPMYYATGHKLIRVWKGRPILSDEDQAEINSREKKAREY